MKSRRETIFVTVHGSHLYGLAHEDSDRDFYLVFEGSNLRLRQGFQGPNDTVRGDITAFLTRAVSGSHQSVEALFSRVKAWSSPEMLSKWGPFLDGFRITGPEVFDKYERTIRKFCYGDFKRRRHAVRLRNNLRDIRESGRFDPRMTEGEIEEANWVADTLEGDELRAYLNV